MSTTPRRFASRATTAALLLGTALLLPRTSRAQAALDSASAAHVRDAYMADLDTVHAKIMQLANAIPEERYAWRPTTGVRSVSEVLMHVASEWYLFVPMSVAGKPPADFGPPRESLPKLEKITGKSDVLAQLDRAWAHCRAELTAADAAQLTGSYKPWGMPLDASAFLMAGDLHEHLGQLIAYARSVGVKPPWSRG